MGDYLVGWHCPLEPRTKAAIAGLPALHVGHDVEGKAMLGDQGCLNATKSWIASSRGGRGCFIHHG